MPDGSWTQSVPLRSVRVTETTPLTFRPDAGAPASFEPVEDMALITDTEGTSASLDGADLVFVGYGITNPAESWDDYAGADVAGKVVVSFVNDPPATAEEPNRFQADTMTYNGRWTYKYEEARRRGARGMLLIHTAETAGYPFGVIADDALGAHPSAADAPEGALAVRGWISERAGRALAEMAGASLDEWQERAGTRGFPRRRAARRRRRVDADRADRRSGGPERGRQVARPHRRGRRLRRPPRPPGHRRRKGRGRRGRHLQRRHRQRLGRGDDDRDRPRLRHRRRAAGAVGLLRHLHRRRGRAAGLGLLCRAPADPAGAHGGERQRGPAATSTARPTTSWASAPSAAISLDCWPPPPAPRA